MKGLATIPSEADLVEAYNFLQNPDSQTASLPQTRLVLWFQWTRFDPRLGEILCIFVLNHWRTLDPLKMNLELKKASWGAAAGVIFETAKMLMPKKDSGLFKSWLNLVMTNVPKGKNEQFFIGLGAAGGARMLREASSALNIYKHWGYLSSELLINKPLRNKHITVMSKRARLFILEELLQQQNVISVADYLSALNGAVSVRQAERDLSTHPALQGRGRTRRRKWYKGT